MTKLKKHREDTGRKAIRFAWGLEILIIALALSMSAAMLFAGARDGLSTAEIILAMAPLVIAGLAELAKIPLASMLVTTKNFLKPVVLVLLAGVCFSSWETMFQGFEHATETRIGKVAEQQRVLDTLEADRNRRVTSSEDLHAKSRDESQNLKAQIDDLKSQKEILMDEIKFITEGGSDPRAVQLRQAKHAAEENVTAILEDRAAAVNGAGEEWQKTSKQYLDRVEKGGPDGEYALALQKKMPAKSAVMTNAGENWDAENGARLAKARADMDATAEELNEYLRNSNVAESDAAKAKQEQIEEINGKIIDLNDRRSALTMMTSSADQEEVSRLEEEITIAKSDLELVAGASMVYRMAGMLEGKDAGEVTVPEARKFGAYFWGSVAAILAIVTAGLAVFGTVERVAAMDKRSPNERKLISNRWNRKQTVVETVEIPVEVEKIIETPVEVEVLTHKYIPVPVSQSQYQKWFASLNDDEREDVSAALKVVNG